MRLIDADKLARDIELAVVDAPAHVQATVQQYIDCEPTTDPIRAAGGCRCGECKHLVDGAKCYTPFGARLPSQECIIVDSDDFCSYGKPREAQDDG